MQTPSSRPIYVIGDIHGQLKKLVRLLQDAQLIDATHSWKAGTASLPLLDIIPHVKPLDKCIEWQCYPHRYNPKSIITSLDTLF